MTRSGTSSNANVSRRASARLDYRSARFRLTAGAVAVISVNCVREVFQPRYALGSEPDQVLALSV